MNRNLERLLAIVADSEATYILTTTSTLARMEPLLAQTPGLKRVGQLTTDDVPDDLAADWNAADINAESLAFLQYTSGSTAIPKGVMVTHRNLLHNEALIQRAFRQTEESIIVGWLPLYHDMGLIGNVLQTVFAGARCVLLSPIAFLQRPLRWLETISRYRATTSGAPNFAYDLCTRKITAEERETLDLSSWTTAFNGSEPVRAETLERFAETFKACGFRASAFYPCYGLAEATLFVSGNFRSDFPAVKSFAAKALEQDRIVERLTAKTHAGSLPVATHLTNNRSSSSILKRAFPARQEKWERFGSRARASQTVTGSGQKRRDLRSARASPGKEERIVPSHGRSWISS